MRKVKRVTQTSNYCKTGKVAYIVMYNNYDREIYKDIEEMPKEVKDFLLNSVLSKRAKATVVYM